MTLEKWLKTYTVTQSEAARRLGVSRQALSQWLHGDVLPGLYCALAIDAYTRGEVPVSEWLTRTEMLALQALRDEPIGTKAERKLAREEALSASSEAPVESSEASAEEDVDTLETFG
jgi:DNA-binding XRE family transcriptional regulator